MTERPMQSLQVTVGLALWLRVGNKLQYAHERHDEGLFTMQAKKSAVSYKCNTDNTEERMFASTSTFISWLTQHFAVCKKSSICSFVFAVSASHVLKSDLNTVQQKQALFTLTVTACFKTIFFCKLNLFWKLEKNFEHNRALWSIMPSHMHCIVGNKV